MMILYNITNFKTPTTILFTNKKHISINLSHLFCIIMVLYLIIINFACIFLFNIDTLQLHTYYKVFL